MKRKIEQTRQLKILQFIFTQHKLGFMFLLKNKEANYYIKYDELNFTINYLNTLTFICYFCFVKPPFALY